MGLLSLNFLPLLGCKFVWTLCQMYMYESYAAVGGAMTLLFIHDGGKCAKCLLARPADGCIFDTSEKLLWVIMK